MLARRTPFVQRMTRGDSPAPIAHKRREPPVSDRRLSFRHLFS
jgi:hypothetical protein